MWHMSSEYKEPELSFTSAGAVSLSLGPRTLLSLDLSAPARICCRAASIWMTIEGETVDLVLLEGQSTEVPPHHRICISSVPESVIVIVSESNEQGCDQPRS